MVKIRIVLLLVLFTACFSYAQDKKNSNAQISQQQKKNAVNQDIFGDDPARTYIDTTAINVLDGKVISETRINKLLNIEKKIKFTKYLSPKDGIMQYGKLGINGVMIYRAN